MTRYPAIDLGGAHVAITGAGQGIGRMTAQRMAAQGARVAVGDIDTEAAKRTAADIGGTAHHLDVTDPASFATFLAEAEQANGPLMILVNNAGIMPNGGFHDLPDEINRATMDVNVFGVIHGMRLALPGMLERGRGHIVNVASLAGKFPVPGLAVYNASKFAVVGLTAATRLEYANHGVSVTAVLPSAVDTALASGLDMRPIPKVKPERIADAVVSTVRTRAAEVAVPGYVGGLATVANLLPEPALNAVRRLVRGDRALQPDTPERTDYRARLNQHAHREEA
ncbi:SDR family NAD(P)-dependent oxidoreductase [Kibdelosporangium aridum]|uniref:SDR family NAD(P)-dependent oxidoreductase n=1 Tax=Kibdelosporangium aridum TaxID=2030 RepID=A0A428ZCM8_KIBAR|nr:SDR family oxidoreductase [Kibdelosporangium aridum]RSM85805.1 SDR family NAD(P)-dependent oxidoreductase [Kibdelosporangium aridum]